MESILTTIKKKLGITEEYEHFDTDIIIAINTSLMTLNQIGVGPKGGFSISSKLDKWSDFLGDATNLEAVKTYVYYRVRLEFDPPGQTSHLDAIKRQADELEWRLQVQAELNN